MDTIIQKAISKNNLSINIDDHDLKILHQEGPCLFVANQALEYIDELVLMGLMNKRKAPYKIAGNHKKFPRELYPAFLPIQPAIIKGDQYFKNTWRLLLKAKEAKHSICLAPSLQ